MFSVYISRQVWSHSKSLLESIYSLFSLQHLFYHSSIKPTCTPSYQPHWLTMFLSGLSNRHWVRKKIICFVCFVVRANKKTRAHTIIVYFYFLRSILSDYLITFRLLTKRVSYHFSDLVEQNKMYFAAFERQHLLCTPVTCNRFEQVIKKNPVRRAYLERDVQNLIQWVLICCGSGPFCASVQPCIYLCQVDNLHTM